VQMETALEQLVAVLWCALVQEDRQAQRALNAAKVN